MLLLFMKQVSEMLSLISKIGADTKAKALWIEGSSDEEFIIESDGSYALIKRGDIAESAIARIACPGFSFSDRLRISFMDETIILG